MNGDYLDVFKGALLQGPLSGALGVGSRGGPASIPYVGRISLPPGDKYDVRFNAKTGAVCIYGHDSAGRWVFVCSGSLGAEKWNHLASFHAPRGEKLRDLWEYATRIAVEWAKKRLVNPALIEDVIKSARDAAAALDGFDERSRHYGK